MATIVAMAAMGCGLAAAFLTFLFFARPDFIVAHLARRSALGSAWFDEMPDDGEIRLYRGVVRKARWWALAVLFVVAFFSGGLLMWVRVGGLALVLHRF